MNELIVVNTGPIIALGKMEAFELVARLPFDLVCPVQVADEIIAGLARNFPVSLPSWIDVIELKRPLSERSIANLDAGEAAVI